MAVQAETMDTNTEIEEDIDMVPNPVDDLPPSVSETISPQKPNTMNIDFSSEAVQLQLAEIDSKRAPRSGYMLFAKQKRQEITSEGGGVSGTTS